jgi:hypothetical protein
MARVIGHHLSHTIPFLAKRRAGMKLHLNSPVVRMSLTVKP